MKCVVCKQEIKDGEIVMETPNGPVHAGMCQQHLNELPVTESSETLNEVELLV